jgi:hypothetical protein
MTQDKERPDAAPNQSLPRGTTDAGEEPRAGDGVPEAETPAPRTEPEAPAPGAPAAEPPEEPRRRGAVATLGAALVVFLAAVALYVATLHPTVGSGDTARLQTAAFRGEIGGEARDHPLTVAVAHMAMRVRTPALFSTAPLSTWMPLADPAYRANLVTALTAALAVLVVFWTALGRLDASAIGDAPSRVSFATAGAASLALAHAFWSRAVVADHTPLVVLLLALATALFGARFRGGGAWTVFVALVLVGLAVAEQRAIGLVAIVYLFAGSVMLASPPARSLARAAWLVALAFALGLVPLMILVWREIVATAASTRTVGDVIASLIGGPPWRRSALDALTIAGARIAASFLAATIFAAIGLLILLARSGGRREGLVLLALIAASGVVAIVTPAAVIAAWVPVAIAAAVGIAVVYRRLKPGVPVTLGILFVALPIAVYLFLPQMAASRRFGPWVRSAYAVPAPGPTTTLRPWRAGDWAACDEAKAILAALDPRTLLVTDPLRAETCRYLLAVDGTRPGLTVLTPEAPDLAATIAAELPRRPIATAGLTGFDLAPVQNEAELIARGPVALARPRPPSLALADRLFAERKYWEAAFNYGEALAIPYGAGAHLSSAVPDAVALARFTAALAHAGFTERAAAVLPRYIAAAGPDTALAHVRLGELFAETGAPTWAEHHFAEALAAAPPPALAAYVDGRIADLRGEHEAALGFYRRALEIDPGLARARVQLETDERANRRLPEKGLLEAPLR